MCESLEDLEKNIEKQGGKMSFFHGDAIKVIEKIMKKHKIVRLGVNQDYTPYARARDEKIEALCKRAGLSSSQGGHLYPTGRFRKDWRRNNL